MQSKLLTADKWEELTADRNAQITEKDVIGMRATYHFVYDGKFEKLTVTYSKKDDELEIRGR